MKRCRYSETVADLKVTRWRKHGHDRLYVETVSGIKVGWFDLRTQKHHLDQPGMWPEFQQAVTAWRMKPGKPAATTQRRGEIPMRKPGEALRERAEKLRPQSAGVRFLATIFRVRTADRPWRVGAQGERKVGARLDPLVRRGWKVLHGVDLGIAGDVDHLVIGPHGVFAVNTKHHPGAVVKVTAKSISVRGWPVPYVAKACRQAQRVRIALSQALGRPVHVTPLVVVHGHRDLSGWRSHRPQGVHVLPSWAVAWWCRLPGRAKLSTEDIEALYAVACQRSTWAGV
jgi:hypothetical protein